MHQRHSRQNLIKSKDEKFNKADSKFPHISSPQSPDFMQQMLLTQPVKCTQKDRFDIPENYQGMTYNLGIVELKTTTEVAERNTKWLKRETKHQLTKAVCNTDL
uniref:Uncharacterized protein n=1 Tax=Onchocerca volvulus TaxID=6282 RepID=A0A8R1XR74_ONCVO